MKKTVFSLVIILACLFSVSCGHNHFYGDWITMKQPTCGESGIMERYCSCGEKEIQYINPTGEHTYVSEVIKEATCNESGTMRYTCTVCGNTYDETIEASHFFYTETVKYADCDEDGIMRYTCERCGSSYEDKIDHSGIRWKLGTYNDSSSSYVLGKFTEADGEDASLWVLLDENNNGEVRLRLYNAKWYVSNSDEIKPSQDITVMMKVETESGEENTYYLDDYANGTFNIWNSTLYSSILYSDSVKSVFTVQNNGRTTHTYSFTITSKGLWDLYLQTYDR